MPESLLHEGDSSYTRRAVVGGAVAAGLGLASASSRQTPDTDPTSRCGGSAILVHSR
jgi:hypothetical protein